MWRHVKVAAAGGMVGGLAVGMAFLMLGSGTWSARSPAQAKVTALTPGGGPTHEDLNEMMDAVHGAGTSRRMHEAMGSDAEEMMDQCAAMVATVKDMQDMMPGSGPGMMGGQNSGSMGDMMRRMMAQ